MPTQIKAADEASSRLRRSAGWEHGAPLVGVLLLILVVQLGFSVWKPFWYDELVTVRIAQMGSVPSIVQFFESGKDTTSFLPAIMVHWMLRLPGPPEVTTRLPFEAAFLGCCACVWAFVRRRYSVGYAAAAPLLLTLTYASYAATEIRSYAFLLLGAGIAIWCWQEASFQSRKRLWAFGVYAGLTVAVLFHVFAVFLLVPLAAAQWAAERQTGTRRWDIWLAGLLSPLGALIMAPGILAAKHLYGNTFWSKPSGANFFESYAFLLNSEYTLRMVAPAVLLLAATEWLRRSGRLERLLAREAEPSGFLNAEWVLVFGLACLPVIGFIGSLALGVFRAQYVLPFFMGLSLLLIGLFAEWSRRETRLGWGCAAVLALLLVWQQRPALKQLVNLATGRPTHQNPDKVQFEQRWWDDVKGLQLPVVAECSDTFLELGYYGTPDLTSRLTYLTSRQHALQFPHSVTNELNMETFSGPLHLQTQDFDRFTAEHRQFLLVVDPFQTNYSWLMNWLMQQVIQTHRGRLTEIWGLQGTRDTIYVVDLDAPVAP